MKRNRTDATRTLVKRVAAKSGIATFENAPDNKIVFSDGLEQPHTLVSGMTGKCRRRNVVYDQGANLRQWAIKQANSARTAFLNWWWDETDRYGGGQD